MMEYEDTTVRICAVCGRQQATDEQWDTVPQGEGEELCWGGDQCELNAVDWRARYLNAKAEGEAAAAQLSMALRLANDAGKVCATILYNIRQRHGFMLPPADLDAVERAYKAWDLTTTVTHAVLTGEKVGHEG